MLFLKIEMKSWVKKMLLASKNQDKAIFVAGGTAHFIGPDNVLSLLKDKGFEITFIDQENCHF